MRGLLLFFGARDSKDERHRATVRWTVVTASDQAAAAARIESLRAGHEKARTSVLFQLNPPLRVGEILLRNVKSSLRSGEIAAAMGGFNFT